MEIDKTNNRNGIEKLCTPVTVINKNPNSINEDSITGIIALSMNPLVLSMLSPTQSGTEHKNNILELSIIAAISSKCVIK